MELVKDIYFNTDKLVENTKVKVSYTGKFYQGNCDKVYIHYGYGKNWNNIAEEEMKKTDLGYQAELKLVGGDTINFCFKNQNNEWDNNFGQNYVFNIEKVGNTELGKTTIGSNESAPKFFGKTFGFDEQPIVEKAKEPNVFWSSEDDNIFNNPVNNFPETNMNGTPNSIDTIIPNDNSAKFTVVPNLDVNLDDINNCNTQIGDVTQLISPVETPVNDNCFKVISNEKQPNVANFGVVNNIGDTQKIDLRAITSEQIKQNNTTTAIALAPTGFNYWTKKIKNTVCKFFATVPKLISGNYKRNVDNVKK